MPHIKSALDPLIEELCKIISSLNEKITALTYAIKESGKKVQRLNEQSYKNNNLVKRNKDLEMCLKKIIQVKNILDSFYERILQINQEYESKKLKSSPTVNVLQMIWVQLEENEALIKEAITEKKYNKLRILSFVLTQALSCETQEERVSI